MKKKKNTLFKDIKHYFETTPQEVLYKDFEEIMSGNQEGPDMLYILPTREQVKRYIRKMKQYNKK